jgi:hypothetical protein
MENKFIEKVRKNKICVGIINTVEDVEEIDVKFTVDEVIALYRTCTEVYNSFCNNSKEDDGLSVYMNRYLDDLYSAMDKLNW